MPELRFSLSYDPFLLLLAAVAALALAVVAYRFTVPPLPRARRIVLGALRASAITLLVLLLGSPIVSLIHRSAEPPGVLVLVDNSRSMTLPDRGGIRSRELGRVLASSALGRVNGLGDVAFAAFDTHARIVDQFREDSLGFTGSLTDISSALSWAREQHLQPGDATPEALRNLRAILLISDGDVTSGMNPVFEADRLGVPVFTVGLGDTVERRDVQIRDLVTNALTYRGSRVPVVVTVRSVGASGERAEVRLISRGKAVDRRLVTLGAGAAQEEVRLIHTADTVGVQRLTAEVSTIPGELTDRNNRRAVSVRVLESRMRVLLVAGGPSADVAVVRRLLGSDENVQLQTFVEEKNGSFHQGGWSPTLLRQTDCVVLVGYPNAESSGEVLNALAAPNERPLPLLVIWNRTIDLPRLRQLDSLLPIDVPAVAGSERQVQLKIPPGAVSHPLFSIVGESDADNVWSQMPPIFHLQMAVRLKPDAHILGVVQSQNQRASDPLVVVRSAPRGKSMVILGYGIWRWKMMGSSVAGGTHALDNLLSNAVRWLTAREDTRRVRVEPVRESFPSGEPVEFRAQVYDESLQPMGGARVQVTLTGQKQPVETVLEEKEAGTYEGAFRGLLEGTYRYTATVRVGGRAVGSDGGSFVVEESAVEFQRTTMDQQLLRQVAQRSGGKYYDAEDLEQLPGDLRALPDFKPVTATRSSELRLANAGWVLVLVVLLFSLEWFVRKRSGML